MLKKSLNLSFFWHMHQPDYRGSDGMMQMPWVFLHAIKDYYEMPWLLSKYRSLKASFNITSPLIEQINLYNEPVENDYFISLWNAEPSQLSDEERGWLIKICKSTQYDTMVKPLEYFDTLYNQENLSDSELLDFEVLFILAWCGNYLRQENSVVKGLFKKGKRFSQDDKRSLLKTLSEFTQTILPFYASLQKDGVISLSTTPYNHPILPLLLDINNAKYANEHTNLPNNPLSLKEDAIEQIESSIELYEKSFGVKPTGLWPAEGAVDEVSVAIYKERGIKWIATDESILFKSIEDKNHSNLYKPYKYTGVSIGFRDHGLSDLIGFNYRFKAGYEASENFIHSLEPIASELENPLVFVILDGENAWEFFENNAYDFFTSLYGRLSDTPWCKTITMDEVSNLKDFTVLERLSAGSWINGDFNTWSGHPEKNRAWEYIYQTRRDVDNYRGEISDEIAKKIKFHFLASECSDWFWWYGDDHLTEFASEFDSLFREHLITIYRLLDIQPPSDLFEPIITNKSSVSFLLKPQVPITPMIDGTNSSFFEWLGSGCVDETKLLTTMNRTRGAVEKIYYGQNDTGIFFAFEGDIISLDVSDLKLFITIEETGKKLEFDMNQAYCEERFCMAIADRVEISLDKSHFEDHKTIHFRFEIMRGEKIVQEMPGFGSLLVELDETYTSNWFI